MTWHWSHFQDPPGGTLEGIPSDFVYLDPRINCINTGGPTKKVKVIVRRNSISGLLFFIYLFVCLFILEINLAEIYLATLKLWE